MECNTCGNDRRIMAKGMCSSCYMKQRRKANPRLSDAQLLDSRSSWEDRFHGCYIERPVTECWFWDGPRTKGDYGMFTIGSHSYPAHRLANMLATGVIPDQVVMHHCDWPSCVNPEHLKSGTYSENTLDAYAKGRLKGWEKGRKRPNQSGDNHWKNRV